MPDRHDRQTAGERPSGARAAVRSTARATAAVVVALFLVVQVATTGVLAGHAAGPADAPTDGPSTLVDDGQQADHKEKNRTSADKSRHTVTEHDFPMPGRAEYRQRRSAALQAVRANATVAELRGNSFVSTPAFRYGAGTDTVVVKTWHSQRVRGSWEDEVRITFTSGFVAEATVDPETGTVEGLRLSKREQQTVTKSYSPAEEEAIAIALDDDEVAATLQGRSYFVSQVHGHQEFGTESASCSFGSCFTVVFHQANGRGLLAAKVSVPDGSVVGTIEEEWTGAASTPDVDAQSFDPVTGEGSHEPVAKNAITRHNWSVSYTVTADNGVRLDTTSYNGTQLLFEAQTPYVDVTYPDGTQFHDELFNTSLSHGPHVHNFSTGFELHATYYLGCSAAQWPTDGCYRYDQRWRFFENGDFQPWLEISGPGFANLGGDPDYETAWRFDTDVGGFDNDATRVFTNVSGYMYAVNETNLPDVGPSSPRFHKWQVRDLQQDLVANVSAFAPDEADWWALNLGGSVQSDPSSLAGDEPVYNRDIMTYYVAHSESCNPNSTCLPGSSWTAGPSF